MLPRKFYVTLDALVYIALAGVEKPVGAKQLAQYLESQPRYLEVVLQSLVKEKILRSVRGPRGGYLLGKERRKIFLSDICSVVIRAEEHIMEKDVELPEYLSLFGNELEGHIYTFLQKHTVDDLIASWRKYCPPELKIDGNFVI